jgi:pyruvate dehydrogenase kinase 2/3/4
MLSRTQVTQHFLLFFLLTSTIPFPYFLLFLRLPVRVAQRAVDLLTLPHGLNEIPAVLQVAHVYLLYLEKFQDCPVPTNVELEDSFTDMLQSMILERSSIPNAIAQGVDAWMKAEIESKNDRDDTDEEFDDGTNKIERMRRLKEMEDALYRFFTARVGLRFLTEHHILSSPIRAKKELNASSLSPLVSSIEKRDNDDKNAFLGCIQPNCCPYREVRKVVEAVRKQTMDYYGDGVCPAIEIVDGDIAARQEQQKNRRKKNNFTYVPHHLHYMVGELLKNSCRATVKRHIESGATNEKIPPIKIVIVKGAEDVTIKIADRGGGIPRSQMSEIFQFAHSTAAKDEIENETNFGVDEITGAAIRGFGLPLARIYAQYLGGELTLKSLEGYGLDAYLHLPRLGNNCENLPLPVQFSPSNLNSNPLHTSTFTGEDDL